MDATRYLVTGDPILGAIWRDEIQNVDLPDETAWEEYVAGVLGRRGFRVVR
jgi:hypothetical protein